jgi:hypothetical protein
MIRSRQLVTLLGFCLALGAVSAGAVEPCPPDGKGGDPIANRLRNRVEVPAKYAELELPGFVKAFTPDLGAPQRREQFGAQLREYVDGHEQNGVTLSGYLVAARRASSEPANCNERARRNIRLWIGEIPEAHRSLRKEAQADGVVAELTPNAQERHGTWRLATLAALAKQGAKVRVSGWPFYDAEHARELGKGRGSVWEIHPVTKIEIWKNGAWQEL